MAGIIANVNNGKLEYDYTDSSKKKEPTGSDLGYDQFLQLLCAEMQYQDPLEPTSNTDYVAQLATFSQLETTLEQTKMQESNMANNLVGKDVIMKVVNEQTGAVNYVEGNVDYVMYQNGEVYLSVNNALYPLSDLDTVADNKYYEAMANAKTFAAMVSAFPDEQNLSAAYEGAVKQVRSMYDGMSEYEKAFIDKKDLTAFEAVETRVNQLVAAQKALEEVKEAMEELNESNESDD